MATAPYHITPSQKVPETAQIMVNKRYLTPWPCSVTATYSYTYTF